VLTILYHGGSTGEFEAHGEARRKLDATLLRSGVAQIAAEKFGRFSLDTFVALASSLFLRDKER
jgi:hypothetical protein